MVDTYLVDKAFEDKLAKLHASGLYIKTLNKKSSFFSLKHQFLITLQKSDLASELLLGLNSTDPFSIALSQYENTTLHVTLTHRRHLFSHTLELDISIDALPEAFDQNNIYIDTLLHFIQKEQNLFHAQFSLFDNHFTLSFKPHKEKLTAQNQISYRLHNETMTLSGFIDNYQNYSITLNVPYLAIQMREANQTRMNMMLKQAHFLLFCDTQIQGYETALNQARLELNSSQKSLINLENLYMKQTYSRYDFMDVISNFSLKHLDINSSKDYIALENFNYDISLHHLDRERIEHLKALIDASNTNEVVFIFNELSESLNALLRDGFRFIIKNLSFKALTYKNLHFSKNALALNLNIDKKRAYNPYFDMNITLSKDLYEYFLNTVPNADLTQYYLKTADRNQSQIHFQLQNSTKGLLLNQIPLTETHP